MGRYVNPETGDSYRGCAICERQGVDPPGEGMRVVGQRYNYYHERYMIFNGYVCELHLEDFTSYRHIGK